MRGWIALAGFMCATAAGAAVPRAQFLWTQGDYRGAFTEAFQPALAGDAQAQFLLGEAYRLGRSVDPNPALAQDWYARAARQGNLAAATELGLGFVRLHQPASALPWLTQAARAGDPRALSTLAALYFNGEGVPPDPVLAYALMTRAAAAGLAEATVRLVTLRAALSPQDQARGEALARGPWPVAVPAAAKQATAAIPAVSGPAVRLQVGAFASEARAEAALAAIDGRVPLAGIDHRVTPAGGLFRLELAFADRAAAQAFARRLGASGWRGVVWRGGAP